MKRMLASFASNAVFANVILVLILISGCIAAMNMVRETFPEFSLDMITISVPYPGANPEEIEESISIKIEEAIKSINGIEQYSTFSMEGRCSANIEVKQGYNVNEVIDNVRNQIELISTFPKNAEKAIIEELFLRDPVALIYVSGHVSERSLKEFSLQIKDEIQRLPDISQVKIFGNREYEIYVEISEKNLQKYKLSLLDVANAISKNNLNLSGGKIKNEQEEISLKTIGRKYTGKELSSMIIVATPDGGSVPLCRLAKIRDDFNDDFVEVTVDDNLATLLIIYKTKEEDSLAISKILKKYIGEKQLILPEGFNLEILYDNTDMLRSRINLLIKNGILGLIIVFISLSVFLDMKLSFWTGIGIFVSISGAISVLYILGKTINMISLFGLIMALGIIVDDAIVVGEAIYFNIQKGKSAFNSAINGVYEVGLPVVTAVGTTIVAFMPLFYVGGIMGKFISILPVVVISCLFISLIESLFLLPAHLSHLSDFSISKKSSNFIFLKFIEIKNLISNKMNYFIYHVYIPFLNNALNYRYLSSSIAIALFLITIGFIRGGILKFEVFPSVDGFIMTSTIEFPDGTSSTVTKNAIKRIDNALLALSEKTVTKSGEPLLKSRLSLVGQTLDSMPKNGSHFGSVQAILLKSEKRGFHVDQLMYLWEKEIGDIVGIKSIKFEGFSAGPPGAPIEIWIQGEEIEILLSAAKDLINYLKQIDGVYQIRSDFSYGKNEIHLDLKPEGRYLNLDLIDLAQQVHAAYYGTEALRIQRGQDDIKIKVRYETNERNNFSDIYKMNIRTKDGQYVPLSSVANISFSPGYSIIKRTDGIRRISVSAGINGDKANANDILVELFNKYFPELSLKYPEILISPQGEQKKTRESLNSLIIGFPLAMLGIFVIIAAAFRSYLQPIVIMFTIPFGIIGAVLGHLILNYNISIMSIFGMVALTGVVVNDAIVLIEKINENLASKMIFFDAVINGSVRRFMAIFLTTISTFGGLMPIIFETDFQAKFIIPMAISMAFGVVFASILTLILVPSFITIVSDVRLILNKIKSGKWSRRELLEPARNRLIHNNIN